MQQDADVLFWQQLDMEFEQTMCLRETTRTGCCEMIDELETVRNAAIMETVDVIQRAQDLFMAAHNHAQDCAVLAAKIAVLVYGLRKDGGQ